MTLFYMLYSTAIIENMPIIVNRRVIFEHGERR